MDIPQEKNKALDGIKKVMYAKDENGEFTKFKYGSKVEEFATETAVHEYDTLKEECLNSIKKGIDSPIKYYMFLHRMDIATLSSYVNILSFKVKRHLKMKHFNKLNDNTLQRYADTFDISLQDLKNFK